ncbi:elongation factor 2 [Nematocida major]|uniref:elongation factor 2 n=1 Tax=Nematocida major TaxID=1912982 RepID=UPI0020072925|nr:elongation factor 2 [Nematocida major]KAH9386979.1 elongation factor 2 [Nematocida major]
MQEEREKKERESPREYVVNLIAHVNHGKTTVMDNVLEHLGVISRSMAGEARLLDSRRDELERGMTMKLSPVSVFFQGKKITFLDTPGHLEFKSLTESTFILSDVSLVIVDATKGVTERLKQLTRGLSENKCRILLLVNKIDALFRLGVETGEIEHRIQEILLGVGEDCSGEEVSWECGNVIIGSARENWALSRDSDPSRALNKPEGSVKLTLKKAVRLAQSVYRLQREELLQLAERVGSAGRPGGRGNIHAKDVMSHAFGFFRALYNGISSLGAENINFSAENSEGVIAVICANIVLNGEIVAIARTLQNRHISVGESVFLMEGENTEPASVQSLLYFTESLDRVQKATGLVGIAGLPCRKRGIVASHPTEEAKAFLRALKWRNFSPLFTDILIPAPEQYETLLEKLSLLARCEPGLFLSTRHGEIIVRSDGALQIDKIKTDLEGFRFTTQDQSGVYQETVEGGSGVVKFPNSETPYKVAFKRVLEVPEENSGGYRRLFGRDLFLSCPEDLPQEVKLSIFSLLQAGPFLLEKCNMLALRVERAEDAGESAPETLPQVYLNSTPRLLVNHTLLQVSVPLPHAKAAGNAISKAPVRLASTEVRDASILFRLRVPVSEIKALVSALLQQTKGEADILPEKKVFFIPPERPEYEQSLSREIRERKGLVQKEKIA